MASAARPQKEASTVEQVLYSIGVLYLSIEHGRIKHCRFHLGNVLRPQHAPVRPPLSPPGTSSARRTSPPAFVANPDHY